MCHPGAVHFVDFLRNAIIIKRGDAGGELLIHRWPLKIVGNDGIIVTNLLGFPAAVTHLQTVRSSLHRQLQESNSQKME